MNTCLKSWGDCASAKNLPGCRRTGTRKSRAPSGVPSLIVGLRRAFGIHDQLNDARVVAEVDEDQTAVVAAACDPAGDRDRAADVVRAERAAVEVAPVHPEILSTSSSRPAVQSARPGSRTVARPPSTITVQPAPSRPACPIWPLCERPP